MTGDPHSALRGKIKPLEAWFGDVMRRNPEPQCRSIDAAKHRVQLALGGRDDAVEPSSETIDQIKRVVRAQLESTTPSATASRDRSAGRWMRIGFTGLAAAAAIAFAVVAWQTRSADVAVTLDDTEFDDFVAVVVGAEADLDVELAGLASELDAFDETFALHDDVIDEGEFDELGDDLDELLGELEESFGV